MPASGVVVGPVTAIDDNVAWPTVITAVPEMPFKVAVIVTAPAFKAVTMPVPSTVARALSDALQVAWVLKVACVPSL